MGIQICIWGSSLYAYGNPHKHTEMRRMFYPRMHIIWGLPYAYGDPHMHNRDSFLKDAYGYYGMHMGISIYAYGDPHMHTVIFQE